jgi:hypothetical protein
MPRLSCNKVIRTGLALAAVLLLCDACAAVQLHPTRSTANDPGSLQDTRLPSPKRLIAVGDVHGDLFGLRKVLRMARVIDNKDHWIAGDSVLVQVGDVLDRGDDERAILELLAALRTEAPKVGGRVVTLLGNHEVMNASGDFRYVTAGGLSDFDSTPGLELTATAGRDLKPNEARRKAFEPGGPWARRIARFGVVVIVGDTLFVHAGLLPAHAKYGLSRINREARMWLLGDGRFPEYLGRGDSPVWTRFYAASDKATCLVLDKALKLAGAKRMVVAHTVQLNGPTDACGGKLWRIDVGLSKAYGGQAAAIDIIGGKVRIIDKFLPQSSP